MCSRERNDREGLSFQEDVDSSQAKHKKTNQVNTRQHNTSIIALRTATSNRAPDRNSIATSVGLQEDVDSSQTWVAGMYDDF
jgi:hypothetical protein